VTGGWRDLTLKTSALSSRAWRSPPVSSTWRSSCAACGTAACASTIFAARYLRGDRYQEDAASAPVEEEDSGPLNLSTPYPITLSRVALHNVNVKIDDTAVSVRDFPPA
jgi:translocation and assembly module TamB